MPRIGSEFYNPNDHEPIPVYHARLVFLERVARHAPEALEALRDDVLPLFRAAWEDAGQNLRANSLTHWPTLRDVASRLRKLSAAQRADALVLNSMGADPIPLTDALSDWQADWNLLDDWCANDALSTLRHWTHVPSLLTYERLYWHPDGGGTWVLELPIESCAPFQPNVETWDAFERRVDDCIVSRCTVERCGQRRNTAGIRKGVAISAGRAYGASVWRRAA